MSKALVVLSGGQDSVTCLGWALDKFADVGCITFNYGQRHSAELQAAARVLEHFEQYTGRTIPHEIVDLPKGVLMGTSPLTNPCEVLETYTDHDTMAGIIGKRVEKTFVPLRNSLFLVLAANRAVVEGYTHMVTGVCEADNANYPDCTEKFINAIELSINESLGQRLDDEHNECGPWLHIMCPLMHLSKANTVRLAMDLPYTYAALAWSHTAYDGAYPPTGKDHASVLRAHGFEQAERPDPLVLRAVYQGLMELPETANYSESNVVGFTDAMREDWGPRGRPPILGA